MHQQVGARTHHHIHVCASNTYVNKYYFNNQLLNTDPLKMFNKYLLGLQVELFLKGQQSGPFTDHYP